jgi:hypothetical protein
MALAAPLSAVGEESTRVIFCSGDCYAVDAHGTRTLAIKGTQLLAGQALETGPGSYAQVKVGTDNAFGVGEKARVTLDAKGIFLDTGRIRVVGSEATSSPIELRTHDSTFVLRGADIEMKKSGPTGPASPVLVKLNAGEATVSGDALANGGVQLVTAGSVIPGAPLPSSEIAPDSGRTSGPVAQLGGLASISLPPTLTPVRLPALPLPTPITTPKFQPPRLVLPPVLPKNMPTNTPTILPPKPILAGGKGEYILTAPVLNTRTGTITTLNTAIITTVDPTYTVKTISPTLISPTLTTTPTTTDTTVLTTTKLSTTTTTTTTTFKLLSPTTTLIRR